MSSIYPRPASTGSFSDPILSRLYDPATGRTRCTLSFDVLGYQPNFGGLCHVSGQEDSHNNEKNVHYHEKEELPGIKDQIGAKLIELKELRCEAALLTGLEQLQSSGRSQLRYNWYGGPACCVTGAFENSSSDDDSQEDDAEKSRDLPPIMLGILSPRFSNQGTVSTSASKQARPSFSHNHQAWTRVESEFVWAAFHQQAERNAGVGCAITDGLVETHILEDVKLPCSFMSSSKENIPVKAIQDSGAAVSIIRASIPRDAEAEIIKLEEPILLTTVLGENVKLTEATLLDLELPCFRPGETRRIKCHLVPDEKMKSCADAYLSPRDAQELGHMIVVHCETCSDAKVFTGYGFIH